MQNFNSFNGLSVIISKNKQVILEINIYNKMNENARK